tara:strand:+ start:1779 stop:3119 length:1341 start_codon:yes stop_codon:yes gene_type:complete
MKWIGQNVHYNTSRFVSPTLLEDPREAAADTDRFVVLGNASSAAARGQLMYRTGSQVLADIGASSTLGTVTSVSIQTDTGEESAYSSSESFLAIFTGGAGIDVTNSTSTITIAGESASVSNAGIVELATTAETTTGTSTTLAVTPDGLKDGYQGSTNVTTLGTISTGTWQGTAIAHAYIGDDAIDGDNIADGAINSEHYVDESIDTTHIGDDQVTYAKIQNVSATDRILGRDSSGAGVIEEITPANLRTMINVEDGATADQTKSDIDGLAITTVGTIDTGTWQGGVIASAYLDSDTVHYSAQRQMTYHMFQDDINTDKIYVGLQESDAESGTASNKNLPFLAPVAGKLLKVFLRANHDLSTETLTWRLETRASSASTSGTPSVVGTQSGAGCTASSMTTYDFTSSLDSGDNIIDAGDTVQLSIQADSDPGGNIKYYVTCLWEWNLS